MADPKDVAAALAAIRSLESGGDYTARSSSSSASGAYQFIDSTWLGRGGGRYASRAYLASPEQQDAIARDYVVSILDANRGHVYAVPEIWYTGTLSHPDSYVPPGNKLSVGEYVSRWMVEFATGGGAEKVGIPTPSEVLGVGKELLVDQLGDLADPFLNGLRRIGIVGGAVAMGMTLVVLGAWRGVKGSG